MNHDHETEALRQQIGETRASLTEKLETLEQQIVETVQGATSAVTDTVENVKEVVHETVSEVKETVHETVDAVKSTLDLPQHVERHPWLMFAGAIAVGFLAERLISGMSERRAPAAPPQPAPQPPPSSFRRQQATGGNGHPTGNGHRPDEEMGSTPPAGKTGSRSETQKEASGLTAMFGDEIDHLKKLAIGTSMGVVRDLVTESAPPPVKPRLTAIIDSVTAKLGGEPVEGSVFAG